jgi:PEP-CTERM motif
MRDQRRLQSRRNASFSRLIVNSVIAAALFTICNSALAQGTASGPSTTHEVESGPIVLIGDPNNPGSPMPIDADPNGLPWTKGFFDPKAWAAGNVTVDVIETIENVGTESWSDWHEVIIGDPLSANGMSFWSNVLDLKVNGTSMTSFTVVGLGSKVLTLDNFSPLVQPGDVLEIHKQIEVFNVAGETQAPLVRMFQYPSIAVPEPSGVLLLGSTLMGLATRRRRKRGLE